MLTMGIPTSGSNNQDILIFLVFVNLICRSQAQDQDFIFRSSSNEIDPEFSRIEDYGPDELTRDKIDEVSKVLAKLLLVPWPDGIAPLWYVEEPDAGQEYFRNDASDESRFNDMVNEENMRPVPPKRARYIRRFPWKRQHTTRYNPAHICSPRKDDVHRLLVALYGERNGKRGQLIDFCDRKRPATQIFSNIHFLG